MWCLLPPSAVTRRHVRGERGSRISSLTEMGVEDFVHKCIALTLFVCWFLFCEFSRFELMIMMILSFLIVQGNDFLVRDLVRLRRLRAPPAATDAPALELVLDLADVAGPSALPLRP